MIKLLKNNNNLEFYHQNKELLLSKCKNPNYLRSSVISDLTSDKIKCFPVTIEITNNNTYLLNCMFNNSVSDLLAPSSINIEWLFE